MPQFKVIICDEYDEQQNIKAATSFQYKHIRICYLKEEAKSKTYYPHHEGSVPLSSGGRPLLGLYQAIRCLHRGLRPLPRHPPPRQLPGPRLQVQAHRVSRPGRVRQAINVSKLVKNSSRGPFKPRPCGLLAGFAHTLTGFLFAFLTVFFVTPLSIPLI